VKIYHRDLKIISLR